MPTAQEQSTRNTQLFVKIATKICTDEHRRKLVVDEFKRKAALEQIREHIARKGHHVYVVVGSVIPRYAYTIGVSESNGAELILAGASFYSNDEAASILDDIVAQITKTQNWGNAKFEVAGDGFFTLRKVHPSWANEFMLGAMDYYRALDIPAIQVIPDEVHWTIDVPDLTLPLATNKDPAWRWLQEAWPYPVSKNAVAITNLAALRGERITEVTRWEVGEWEMFAGAGPDVAQGEVRAVPLGMLLGWDESLVPVVNLELEEGLWRDPTPNSAWHPWRKREGG
jgi:uncharacterized protein DUF4262